MNFKQRQVIHLSMEKTDVKQMAEMKDELGLESFAEVQQWLLKRFREGRLWSNVYIGLTMTCLFIGWK